MNRVAWCWTALRALQDRALRRLVAPGSDYLRELAGNLREFGVDRRTQVTHAGDCAQSD